jgi:ribosomal protein S6--L-glutamate ligase
MHFCFIIEAQYRHELMPMVIVRKLMQWGHEVDLLEPQIAITSLTDIARMGYDAYVLKTVSDGPGLSILEAAEAAGIPTINHSRAIRLVRDKAIATTRAIAHHLPTPQTYFAAHPGLFSQIPAKDYPLVIKPANGSSCRAIYKVNRPDDLATLDLAEAGDCFFLAQHYIENSGYDIKLYVAGQEVFAIAKRSPLHPEREIDKQLIEVPPELRELALRVGDIFGLDIYGLDIVETPEGPVLVDVNDFPSFGRVPDSINLVAGHIVKVAERRVRQKFTFRLYDRSSALQDDIAV